MKIFFTWWNKQTFGTYLKTLFFGKFVGTDEYGNKYYQSKSNERWVIYSRNVEATKITSNWFLWMHHTIDKIPEENEQLEFLWQKEHLENQTGTRRRHNPAKIKKGSGEPNINKVSNVSWDQVKAIAEDKMVDLNAFTVNSAMKMVAGTARSMGIKVNGGEPPTE